MANRWGADASAGSPAPVPDSRSDVPSASVDLLRRFENPSPRYGPVPLWWWSGERLDLDRLCWQLDQLVAGGIHQAVVMNLAPAGPLYGALADDPPFMSPRWWDIFNAVCTYGEQRGFQLWLYDQIGFSGANIQGHLVAENPDHAGRALTCIRADASTGAVDRAVPSDGEPLAAWFAPSDGSPVTPVPVVDRRAAVERGAGELVVAFTVTIGFDYFSNAASSALIDRVFGEYERRLGHQFGRGIGGVFQDELPDVPGWSHDFLERFEAEAGYDLLPFLPALFGDPVPAGALDSARARLDYHRVRALLARRAFFDPLSAWLDAAGLPCGFDQQSPARDGSPTGGVVQYADYLQTHAGYRIPGNDQWGDSKIHSSLAHANGHDRVWIEAFYSSGWGGTLEETYDWLAPYFRRGANLYNPHAVYYSTRSGWFEWAPPSTCWRQPYWPAYPAFSAAVTRLSSILTAGVHVASTVLYTPTEFVQSATTTRGEAPDAADAERLFTELNGRSSWIDERRGLLDRAGVDYDILDAHALAAATLHPDGLELRGEVYGNVVLPGAEMLDAGVAEILVRFTEGGGRLVIAGEPPHRLVEPLGMTREPAEKGALLERLRRNATIVPSADEVAGLLVAPPVHVRADAPVLHRRVGDVHLITAVAHDERSGTAQPIVANRDVLWSEGVYSWSNYWHQLGEHGYRYLPPGDRPLTVHLDGVSAAGLRAQSWDPRTGRRRALPLTGTETGVRVDARFDAGTFAVIVVGTDLPPVTEPEWGQRVDRRPVTGDWEVRAESTLDNRWGDVDARSRPGVVPIQVWSFDHTTADEPARVATATFGPFAEITDDAGEWIPAEWSLSRGIQKDPIHDRTLGPSGYIPEEFVRWSDVPEAGIRRLRTTITVPAGGAVWLAVGSNATRRVWFAGAPLVIDAAGYLSFSEIPAGTGLLEIELTTVARGDLRAFFALTTDPARFARPEWMVAADEVTPSTTVTAWTTFELSNLPSDARVQLSTESPTVLVVNGTDVGLQSAFDPQSYHRITRVHPYDVAPLLRVGENRIEVRVTDTGHPVSFRLDSVPAEAGGLGIISGPQWMATRDGRALSLAPRYTQIDDPRYGCIVARPHPLQDATWLDETARDGSVLNVIPDLNPAEGRVEMLSFVLPIGTTAFTVPTSEPFEVDGATVDGTTVRLDAPARAGQRATLKFRPTSGRRAGALLDGPVSVETVAAAAPLAPWHELGLGALGGAVHYTRHLDLAPPADGERVVLDLGTVRGTAEVRVDGVLVDTLFAGPWRVELTEAIRPGATTEIEVTVRGTLAPYLDVASPTTAVAAGQKLTGLLGPVSVERWSGGR